MKTLIKPDCNFFSLVFLITFVIFSSKIYDLTTQSVEIKISDEDNPITKLNKHVLSGQLLNKNTLVFNGANSKIIVINIEKDDYFKLINYINLIHNDIKKYSDTEYEKCRKIYNHSIQDHCTDFIFHKNKYDIDLNLIKTNYKYLFYLNLIIIFLILNKVNSKKEFLLYSLLIFLYIVILRFQVMNNYNFLNLENHRNKEVIYRYIYSIPNYIFDSNNTSQDYLIEFSTRIGCSKNDFYIYRFLNGNALEILSKKSNLEECLFKSDFSYVVPDKNKFNFKNDGITLIRKYKL